MLVTTLRGFVLAMALPTALSPQAAFAASVEAQGSSSGSLKSSSDSEADFLSAVASERVAPSRDAAGGRQAETSGSLLLMEIRTHHGSTAAASVKAAILDLDPRTKPLGW
jgi:hypothetical protein